MIVKLLNDERGISAEVFKLAAAVIIVAAIIGIIIGIVISFRESSEASVETFGDVSLDEVQSNAEKI